MPSSAAGVGVERVERTTQGVTVTDGSGHTAQVRPAATVPPAER